MKSLLLFTTLLSCALSPVSPAQTCHEVIRDASGQVVQTIERQKQAGGTERAVIRDASGRIVGTAGVTRPVSPREEATPADSPLSVAIRYISQHYADRITNEDLARTCGLSVRAFERQFQAAYHSSPHDYLRQLRVRMSCSALVFSRKSLAEVATEFGFADQSHFTKEFRKFMSETPRAYRSRYQQR